MRTTSMRRRIKRPKVWDEAGNPWPYKYLRRTTTGISTLYWIPTAATPSMLRRAEPPHRRASPLPGSDPPARFQVSRGAAGDF
jgi:hypothetical protein